jgi:hypothetical protein
MTLLTNATGDTDLSTQKRLSREATPRIRKT